MFKTPAMSIRVLPLYWFALSEMVEKVKLSEFGTKKSNDNLSAWQENSCDSNSKRAEPKYATEETSLRL